MPSPLRLGFLASERSDAQEAYQRLTRLYGQSDKPDVLVVLGGDGMLLQTLHRHIHDNIPIFGLNRGSIGFLMNDYGEEDLMERILKSESTMISPLLMRCLSHEAKEIRAYAFNEVSLWRQTSQGAKIEIRIDGKTRLEELICDGVLLATPAGSTAYNLSAHGPIIPIKAKALALTPISAFRPRRWRGAIVSHTAKVEFIVHEADKRPIIASADTFEVRFPSKIMVEEASNIRATLLFDAGKGFDERVLTEQFST